MFTERTVPILEAIAEQATVAVHNARIHEHARRSSDEHARLLDIERTRRLQAEQTSSKSGAFLAQLSHDLLEPLSAMLGLSEVLLAREGEEGERGRALAAIARNARAQAEVIARLNAHRAIAQPAAPVTDTLPPMAVMPAPQPIPAELSLSGTLVLVIDNAHDARQLVKMVLADAHADVITAASADEGLALLRQLRPDVIVSDIGMAVRDGYQFMRLVRTMPECDGGGTPALALSALVQNEDRVRALLAGYQDYLTKPVEAERLIAAVHRLASRAT
jgi:CheY-like chemotaxis protein